ncbi:interleukin-6 receptor subunit alpha [Parambassis ranga]|uniref:Interleukin-6 receptor subunit alpha n=1 Tax=Parambassis ranga TaxID=210632 RepID=A0A6P7K1N5_9TELE|nr:interleukin-6 receptor subunit alpha-like [Parambassis ranga]
MWLLTFLLCFVCVPTICSIFDGTCPRKEPPPGVLVVRPGITLLLTCSGHIEVDGVKVSLTKINPRSNKSERSAQLTTTTEKISSAASAKCDSMKSNESDVSHSQQTEAGVSSAPGHTASPHILQPSSASTPLESNSNREGGYDGDEEEKEEEESDEGSRVTRGIKTRPVWMWNRSTVGKGDRDWGNITFRSSGTVLTLASVRLTDSGKFTCHHRGKEKFAVKVIVADPPESPSLFCYKKSPRGKIRCEWSAQRPFIKPPNCSLLLSKSLSEKSRHLPCSYSSQRSRCWCALDYNEDEQRILHMVYLCVTSITGNATSSLLYFTPLSILRPDPPSDVSIRQVEGHETRIQVTWNLPSTWKLNDRDFALIYEVKYRPSMSSVNNDQVRSIDVGHSYTIMDTIPGVEYIIQLRAKDEFEGHWSDWSAPVYARSWTAPVTLFDDSTATVFELPDPEDSGSGADDEPAGIVPYSEGELPHHIIWVSGVFVVLFSVILAAFIFRHKNKPRSHSVSSLSGDLPPTSAPATPEVQALVTFDPLCYKERPLTDAEEEEEHEEEQTLKDRMEATHFDNTSYFFLHRE